jgi:hypothetical protein
MLEVHQLKEPAAFTCPGNIPDTHFCQRLNRAKRNIAAGRFTLMKIPGDVIRNQNHILPACGAVPQPSALWRD